MAEPKWRFRYFVDADGKTPYRDWLESLPDSAQAAIKARLELTGTLEKLERPYVAHEGGGILKVRVTDLIQKIEYRLLGCYGPESAEITLLVGAIEKNRKLIPPSVYETAEKRKRTVDERKRNARKGRET